MSLNGKMMQKTRENVGIFNVLADQEKIVPCATLSLMVQYLCGKEYILGRRKNECPHI